MSRAKVALPRGVGRGFWPLGAWALVVTTTGCPVGEPESVDLEGVDGETLFGHPEAATGLAGDVCGPTCTCAGEPWTPPEYGEADVAA